MNRRLEELEYIEHNNRVRAIGLKIRKEKMYGLWIFALISFACLFFIGFGVICILANK